MLLPYADNRKMERTCHMYFFLGRHEVKQSGRSIVVTFRSQFTVHCSQFTVHSVPSDLDIVERACYLR